MRFRFRLRTALIAIAVLSLMFACLTPIVRLGGFGQFWQYHASLYNDCSTRAELYRVQVDLYREHVVPGHSCSLCREYLSDRNHRPIAQMIVESQRQQREYERKARWHGFLANPLGWLLGRAPRPVIQS